MERPFVLIIEDERDIAALFRHVMDLAGYQTEVCSNGSLALERLRRSRPDIVLLDLSLPGVSGVHILQHMRADERLQHIPVVVVTAYAELAESLSVEPDLVMLKPISAVQLTDLVQRLSSGNGRGQTAPFGANPSDALTGLYTRSFFLHRLTSSLASLHHDGQALFAVLALSPDLYELLSHEHGRRQADEFLHALAAALRACVRPTDTLARFEGDHFFLLVEQAPDPQVPEMIAARIGRRLGAGLLVASTGPVSLYTGVLLCDRRYAGADEIVRDACAAYDLARAAGPGACLTFDYDTVRAAAHGG